MPTSTLKHLFLETCYNTIIASLREHTWGVWDHADTLKSVICCQGYFVGFLPGLPSYEIDYFQQIQIFLG